MSHKQQLSCKLCMSHKQRLFRKQQLSCKHQLCCKRCLLSGSSTMLTLCMPRMHVLIVHTELPYRPTPHATTKHIFIPKSC